MNFHIPRRRPTLEEMEAANNESRFSDWRLALQSILIFWTFYLVTVLLRASLSPTAGTDLLVRSLYAIVGVVLSGIVYAAIRFFAKKGSLQRTALVAALAILPCSIAMSMIGIEVARQGGMEDSSTYTTREGATITQVGGTVTINPPSGGTALEYNIDLKDVYERDRMRLIANGTVVWFFLLSTWAAIYIALTLQRRARISEARLAAAETAAQAAQIRALRYQVNPHFLFNTLNSLSSLVMSGHGDRAEEMLMALSTFFRTSLSLDPGANVTLAEEIDLQRLYLDIERVRFPKRLEVDIDVPSALQSLEVPALILQPLVENAIKYGVSATRDRVSLSIVARSLDGGRAEIVITNRLANLDEKSLPAAAAAHKGTGLGLANVCERLRAHFGDHADCRFGPIPGGYQVSLAIPVQDDDQD